MYKHKMAKQKHKNHKYYKATRLLFRMFSAKSHFNICWKIYSQTDFE